MSFTLSFVIEVLIGGCFCSIWVILLINKILGGSFEALIALFYNGLNMGAAALFLCLILIYILGWVTQYFCDLIFDNFFEKKIKGSPFKEKQDFYRARGLVMQDGSKTILDDIQMDRQLLRLSKQICLNFFFIFLVCFLYISESWIISIIALVLSLIIIIVSFFQWKKRYISVMYKFHRAEQSILLLKSKLNQEE